MTAAGFHGKMPCLGDFVLRRLPGAFVEPWDAACGEVLSALQYRHGNAWGAWFAAQRAWRFAVASDLCGALPWIGVAMPSHDRIGRPFPLIVARAVEAGERGWPRLPTQAWFGAAEVLLTRAVAGEALHVFDRAVTALPDPADTPALPIPPSADATARFHAWQGADIDHGVSLPGLPDGGVLAFAEASW
jgi:type VI secretion system protein ImpM